MQHVNFFLSDYVGNRWYPHQHTGGAPAREAMHAHSKTLEFTNKGVLPREEVTYGILERTTPGSHL